MDWDVDRLMNQIELAHRVVEEYVQEPFSELARKDPKKAVEEFPRFMGSVTSGIFRPSSGIGAPLINALGMIYPALDQETKTKVLTEVCLFFGNIRYDNVQRHYTANIHEPALMGDIAINHPLYWCGFESDANKLKNIHSWDQFREAYISERGTVTCNSAFWLLFALSRKETKRVKMFEKCAELFPEFVERTKDAISGWIYSDAERHSYDAEPVPFEVTVQDKMKRYISPIQKELETRVNEKPFILLPKYFSDLEYHKRYEEKKRSRK